MSRLDPSFIKIWTCRSSPWSRSRNAWTWIKNVEGASCLSNFWNIFSAIQKICCRIWWQWTKPDYITMSQRQSNNQWSGGIAAHPAPKHSKCKNCWKSSHLNFLRSRWHTPHWLSSKGPNCQREVVLISAGAVEAHFERKTLQEGRQGSLVPARVLQLTGLLQPRRNWPTWASNVLITHHILRIWPRRTTVRSLDWKKQLKGRHFSSDAEVIAAAEPWLDGQPSEFLGGSFQKLQQWAKKCTELRGEYVE